MQFLQELIRILTVRELHNVIDHLPILTHRSCEMELVLVRSNIRVGVTLHMHHDLPRLHIHQRLLL